MTEPGAPTGPRARGDAPEPAGHGDEARPGHEAHPEEAAHPEEVALPEDAALDALPRPRALPGRLVWVVAIAMATIVGVLDQATKQLAERQLEAGPIDLGLVSLTLVRNPNAAFGIPGFTGMFLIVTVIVLAIIVRMLTRTDRFSLAAAFGLVAGGAIGNAVDRITRPPGFPDGAVVDFVNLGWFPVFNVADAAITVGAILVVLLLVITDRQEARRAAARVGRSPVRPETASPRR